MKQRAEQHSPPGGKQALSRLLQQPDNAPPRVFGLGVMMLIVLFVIGWLSRSATDTPTATAISLPLSESATFADGVSESEVRFDPAFLMLPAEPLLGFVPVPAGEFIMGSDPAQDSMAYANERWSASQRQGRLVLPRYYIARYEVTVAQYQAFLRNTGAQQAANTTAHPAYPIVGITLPEALAYARWLETQLRQSPRTPLELRDFLAAGGRITLPSEAEWEKAARGSDGRVFPWGSQARPGFANFQWDAPGGTAAAPAPRAVGSFPCPDCAYGLADMSGNVWELTRSPMQPYPFATDHSASQHDPEMLAQDALWVMRGGSYADTIANVRAAVRGGADPGVRHPSIGFRLVISKTAASNDSEQ